MMNSSIEKTPGNSGRPQGLVPLFNAGAVYFFAAIGIGFVLESARMLWVAPRYGEKIAALLEIPSVLLATIVAARWVVDRFALPPLPGIRLGVGCVALVLLLVAEFTVILPFRGLSIYEYFASQDPIAGTASIGTLGVLTVMPFLVAHRWDR